jgi:hypothetical protein
MGLAHSAFQGWTFEAVGVPPAKASPLASQASRQTQSHLRTSPHSMTRLLKPRHVPYHNGSLAVRLDQHRYGHPCSKNPEAEYPQANKKTSDICQTQVRARYPIRKHAVLPGPSAERYHCQRRVRHNCLAPQGYPAPEERWCHNYVQYLNGAQS